MARQVVWTEAAADDLDAAAAYIAKDSVGYAATFVENVLVGAGSLAEMALRGRRVPEARDATVREVYVGSYRLIYQVAGPEVFVLALVHARRDLPSGLKARAGRRR